MSPLRTAVVWLLFSILAGSVGPVAAKEFAVFPAKVSLPVQIVAGGQITKRTLKESDVVNLALGRPLGTKVDKKTEILAVAVSLDADAGSLMVFNPSQNGLAQITARVGEATTVDFEDAFLSAVHAGIGSATGTVNATTLGVPAANGLLPSTVWSGGAGKITYGGKASVTVPVAGRLSFTVTEKGQTTTLGGFIVKGKAKVGGSRLTIFDDGNDPPACGDGIVQPGLGEECEFNHQEACPGSCDACICVVCGNARIDPGEICDGATLGVCAQLMTTCKSDCTGCTF